MDDTMRQIVNGDPYAAEKVARAVEVEARLDAAQKAGEKVGRRLHANREAREAGLWKR
jgi:hypothetical protein